MLSFDLKVSPEATSFGPKLKQVTYTLNILHRDKLYACKVRKVVYCVNVRTVNGIRS